MAEAGAAVPALCRDSIAQVEEWLDREAREGDCILFKGSNSMKLSEAVAYFLK